MKQKSNTKFCNVESSTDHKTTKDIAKLSLTITKESKAAFIEFNRS